MRPGAACRWAAGLVSWNAPQTSSRNPGRTRTSSWQNQHFLSSNSQTMGKALRQGRSYRISAPIQTSAKPARC